MDHLRWYCPVCGAIVHEASFHCADLASELAPVVEGYYANEALRRCSRCRAVDQPPGSPARPAIAPGRRATAAPRVDPATYPREPVRLAAWIDAHREQLQQADRRAVIYGAGCELHLSIVAGPASGADLCAKPHDVWLHQLQGDATVQVRRPRVAAAADVDAGN